MEFPIQRVTYFFFSWSLLFCHVFCLMISTFCQESACLRRQRHPCFVSVGVCLRQRVCVRPEVAVNVQHNVFTVAILAQGTNRGDALCAALFTNRITSNPSPCIFLSQHIQICKQDQKVVQDHAWKLRRWRRFILHAFCMQCSGRMRRAERDFHESHLCHHRFILDKDREGAVFFCL